MNLDVVEAYLLLGSNLGDRLNYLEQAIRQIDRQVGKVISRSSVYETEAWGKEDQPGFLNIALLIQTSLDPTSVLKKVLQIEESLGRIRDERWGARLIDIDIILYGNQIIDISGVLQIPHPEMQHRKFVLQPLHEIAPEVVHPKLKQTISTLLSQLEDPLNVEKRLI